MRAGFGFGAQILAGVLFAQLLISLLNPPTDRWGFLAVVIVVDVVVFFGASAFAGRRAERRE